MLQYGVILGAASVTRWQLRCIERLSESGLAELRCVVAPLESEPSRAETGRTPRPYDAVPLAARVDPAAIFSLAPDAARAPVPVDFFLLFGEARDAAPFARAARFGVWYFAFGDLTRFSTDAPGFWEVHGERDATAAYLLRLTPGNAAGIHLKSAYLPTVRDSFERNAEALLETVSRWPQQVCSDIVRGAAGYFGAKPLPKPLQYLGRPSLLDIAAMRMRERRNRMSAFVRSQLCSIEWTIASVKERPAEFIGGERRAQVRYLYPHDKRGYFADPCLFVRDSRPYVFCEEYRSATSLGSISVSEIVEGGATAPQRVIAEAHHLSYPHVFEHGGATYCIPEAAGTRKVSLYRCVEFPHKWEPVRTLIDGFEANDSTIVHYEGRWWLFCTSSDEAPKGRSSHLYIWYADDLFGEWKQHAGNPVKIDTRSARPAGAFFMHDGSLYRPAQDCARWYGSAIRINRVDVLTPYEFEESVVGTIRPPRRRYKHGLHTLSATDDYCVVDVERYVFSPENAAYALRRGIKHVLLRAGVSESLIASVRRRLISEAAEMRAAQPSKSE